MPTSNPLNQSSELPSVIPSSPEQADESIKAVMSADFCKLDKVAFLKGWYALFYLFPGFHTDDCDDWPSDKQKLAEEAFKRAERGELDDEELYPSHAIRARLFWEMANRTTEDDAPCDLIAGKAS